MPKNLFSTTGISASGMAAERQRMELIANNIANANSTRSVNGQPYQRKQLIFESAINDTGEAGSRVLQSGNNSMGGVRVVGVAPDESEFPMIYIAGHPDADENGMVRMPNVSLPNEMVDLISASRSYEANLRALSLYKEMVEQTLSLLSGGR
jgi:flagellar basal-body rod protein FlgC